MGAPVSTTPTAAATQLAAALQAARTSLVGLEHRAIAAPAAADPDELTSIRDQMAGIAASLEAASGLDRPRARFEQQVAGPQLSWRTDLTPLVRGSFDQADEAVRMLMGAANGPQRLLGDERSPEHVLLATVARQAERRMDAAQDTLRTSRLLID